MNIILLEKTELHITEDSSLSAFLPHRDERAVHLLKTLRKKAGDTFEAGVLGGKLGEGTIIEVASDGLDICLTEDADPPPRTPLRLGVGFPRPIQLRRLLRDSASLGLAAVNLIGTELGEKSYRDTKLLKDGGARSALIEGAVQARDTRLPELAVYRNLAAWLQTDFVQPNPSTAFASINTANTAVSAAVLFAADNVHPQGSFSALDRLQPGTGAVVAVGSERGWSDREREQLEQAGFLRLSLGKRALRTETACTAAAVLVMEKMGLLE